MNRKPYGHTEDEIDHMVQALGQLKRKEGMEAAWAALPDGWEPMVKRLMQTKKVGFVRAAEILLRLGTLQWTS